jgi:hypothetical protein
MPQRAHAISFRGNGFVSGDRGHAAEHVPHCMHFLRESPPLRLRSRMNLRSGSTTTGFRPLGDARALRGSTCSKDTEPAAAVSSGLSMV